MSGSSRKCISKCDLKEVPQHSLGVLHNEDWPMKSEKFLCGKESQPGWYSSGTAVCYHPKSYDAEANTKVGKASSDASMSWDEDGSYLAKMSPGLDDWRQQKHGHSPAVEWGRSCRSRSPRGLKRESGSNDRSVVARPCKALSALRSSRGDSSSYLHWDDKYYEDRRYSDGGKGQSFMHSTSDYTSEHLLGIGRVDNLYNDFLEGKCHGEVSCKYAHHSAACMSKGNATELFIGKEMDRRHSSGAFEYRYREPRRKGDIPCKFFAAGNCRSGKSCRFSHNGQTRDLPTDRSRDDWRRRSDNLDDADQLRESLKWNDTTVSDVGKLPECNDRRNGNVGVPQQRATASSMDYRWEHNLNNENRYGVHLTDSDKAVESTEKKYLQLKAKNIGSSMGASESRGAKNWSGDMVISPAGNYRLSSSNIFMEEPGHIPENPQSLSCDETNLQSSKQDITREVSQKHNVVTTLHPLISEKSSNCILRDAADADAFSCKDWKTIRNSVIPNIDHVAERNRAITDTQSELLQEGISGNGQQLSHFVTGEPSGDDQYKSGTLVLELNSDPQQLNHTDQVAHVEGMNNKGAVGDESQRKDEGHPSLEKKAGDRGADKNNNAKVIHVFKFALAEFVKEILRPTWMGGHISKDLHKVIVKKVVDKVSQSIQEAYVPRSKERVDNYLSASKPKLCKLVQAYVEKYQKS